jgi:hypothetical protein
MDQSDMTETRRMQEIYSRGVAARGEGGANHASPEALLALVEREGSEDERLATLEHVMACGSCHREYEWLTAVNEAGLEAAGAAGGTQRRAWWRSAPLALAASIAVVGAGVALSGVLRGGAERERGTRSDITLVSPGMRAVAGAPLTFAWRPLAGASRYVLELQRADGSIAIADTTADTLVTLTQPSAVLSDSAYRWWVREVSDGAEPRSSELRDLRLR